MPLHFKKLIYPAIDLSKNALKRISLKMCKLSEKFTGDVQTKQSQF